MHTMAANNKRASSRRSETNHTQKRLRRMALGARKLTEIQGISTRCRATPSCCPPSKQRRQLTPDRETRDRLRQEKCHVQHTARDGSATDNSISARNAFSSI